MIASPNNKKLDKPDKNKGYHSHLKPDPKNLYSTSLPLVFIVISGKSRTQLLAPQNFHYHSTSGSSFVLFPAESMNERRCETKQEGEKKEEKGKRGTRKKRNKKEEKARIFPSNVFHEQFLSTPTRRHHDAHLPRNSRSPPIVHRGNYYSHFCDACSRSSFAG